MLGEQETSASQQIQELQEQNDMLKSVIHQMRQDMEQLSGQLANENAGEIRKGEEQEGKQPITEG